MGLIESKAGLLVQDPGRVAELVKRISIAELSPVSLLKRYLERISAVDSSVRAWRFVATNQARAIATACEAEAKAGQLRGPLHGIPFAVKDTIDVEGIATLCGSRAMGSARKATSDAAIVLALRAAGAIPVGKVHTTEFAFFDPSPARNPHNPAHTPGGSSSGSAAAVAAGMIPLAIGSQTVASVNRPAAYCGIGAFKPSTGALLGYGVAPLAPMFDTIGFFGHQVEDAIDMFDAVRPAFFMPGYIEEVASPAQVIVVEDSHLDDASGEMMAAMNRLAKAMREAGHQVTGVKSPVSFAHLFELQQTAMHYEMGRVLHPLKERRSGMVGEHLLAGIQKGEHVAFADYRNARDGIAEARSLLLASIGNDVVLWPAAPGAAPHGLSSTGDPRYIAPWTAFGGPIVSIPTGHSTAGLPLGCLLTSRPGSDARLSSFARKVAPIARAAFA